jgi:protocatechuate 3,4-dioxygenase beta subunit
MWETGTESEPLAEFKVVSDTYTDGHGEWGIKTSNPTAYYSLI